MIVSFQISASKTFFMQQGNIIKRLLKSWRNQDSMEETSTHAFMYKKSKKGLAYVALYIDDNLIIGGIKAIGDTSTALK